MKPGGVGGSRGVALVVAGMSEQERLPSGPPVFIGVPPFVSRLRVTPPGRTPSPPSGEHIYPWLSRGVGGQRCSREQ